MTYKDIEVDPCVKDFLRSRGLKESTKKEYLMRLYQYSKFTKKTPAELIDEAEEEQDRGIKSRKRKLKGYILDFIENLKNNNRSYSTIKSNLDTVFAFYREFDVDPPRIRNIIPKNHENPSFDELPDLSHVKQAIKSCSIRDRAIILLHFSSGMGASELRHLTCRDFVVAMDEYLDLNDFEKENMFKVACDLKDKEDLIGTWKIRRFKTQMPYITFNSPESTLAIIDYIFFRYNRNKPVKNLEDPLFISQYNNQVAAQSHQKIFQRVNDKVGFGNRTEKRRFFTSHMLRKLFTTSLYKAGVDKLAIDWMLGHKINPVTEAYFKTNEKELKKNYLKALPHLTLEKVKVRRMESEEVKDIVRDLDKKDKEMDEMRKKVELLEGVVQGLLADEESKSK